MVEIIYPLEKYLWYKLRAQKCRYAAWLFTDIVSVKKAFQYHILKIKYKHEYFTKFYKDRICLYLLTDLDKFNYWITYDDENNLLLVRTKNNDIYSEFEIILETDIKSYLPKIDFLKIFLNFWNESSEYIDRYKRKLNNGESILIGRKSKFLKLRKSLKILNKFSKPLIYMED